MTNLEQLDSKSEAYLLPADSNIELLYFPRHIGEGGEHIVYEVHDRDGEARNIVAKASKYTLAGLISAARKQQIPLREFDPMSEEFKDRAEGYVQHERDRAKILKQHFGAEHTLTDRKYFVKVPITSEILETVAGRVGIDINQDDLPEEFWTIVTFQRRLDVMDAEDTLSLVAGYAEFENEPKTEAEISTYNKVNSACLFGTGEITTEEFLQVQGNNKLRDLVNLAEQDPELAEQLKNLVASAIDYSNATGEQLDLAGSGNLILFRGDNAKWIYMLPDALYPGSPGRDNQIIWIAAQHIQTLAAGGEIDDGDANVLLNCFNYIRTINGLATLLGVKDRIKLFQDKMPEGVTELELLDVVKRG